MLHSLQGTTKVLASEPELQGQFFVLVINQENGIVITPLITDVTDFELMLTPAPINL